VNTPDTRPRLPSKPPSFNIELAAPDLARWRAGNCGIAGVTSFAAEQPGPHIALMALMHGNEFAGAIVLAGMLAAGTRPARGRLSFIFANLDAFDSFDPDNPTHSRFCDEDLNRVWDAATLDGPRQSSELTRARQLRPWLDNVDVLLDLHSMLWPSDPLILCGLTDKARTLALAVGTPALVIADGGHVGGRRLIDYARFADPATDACALLVEAGQHWAQSTVAVTEQAVAGLVGMGDQSDGGSPGTSTLAEVTATITAASANFVFLQPYRGGDIIAHRNTLIAMDGNTEIRTGYDNCLLVMPSLRPSRGHTAVRLAKLLPGGAG
jgi:hypothetical protein